MFFKLKDVVWSLSYFLMEMFTKVQEMRNLSNLFNSKT